MIIYLIKLNLILEIILNLSSNGYVAFVSRLIFWFQLGKRRKIFWYRRSLAITHLFHGDDNLLNSSYINEITDYQYFSINNFQFPIRGYNIAQKFGNKALIVNFELRLPFLIYYFPTIKYFGQIFGVLFIDAGVAWNRSFATFF